MKKILMFFAAMLLATSIDAQPQGTVRLFSHRGGRMENDENTLQAFNRSYKIGYRGYETDIRMTKDGVLILTHDNTLERTTNGTGQLEEKTAEQIKGLVTKKGNKVMMFDEFCDWLKSKGDMEYVEFELKTKPVKSYPETRLHKMCDMVVAKVKEAEAAQKTKPLFIITSSDERGLKYIQKKYPEMNLLWIVGKPVNDETIAKCLELGIPRLGAMMPGTSRDAVKKAHDKGLIVSLWPSSKVEDIMLGIYLGSNTLCTDVPEASMKLLKKQKWLSIEY